MVMTGDPNEKLSIVGFTDPLFRTLLADMPEEQRLASMHIVDERGRVHSAGRAVMLIDDIVTTGTTLSTAAELLLEAGVGTVYGVALLHTERTSLGRSTQPPAHARHQPQGRWKAQHGSIASAAQLPGTAAPVPDADLESERRCEA